MTTELLVFDDYVVTDTGDVIVKYMALVKRLREGKPIDGLCTFPHPDVAKFNQRNPKGSPVRELLPDGTPSMIPARRYRWDLPEKYRSLNVYEYASRKLVEKGLFDDDRYIDRTTEELDTMCEREMEDFIRLLIYMVEVFEENDVVRGVGRGSACASLVLFLIGIHMIDPIVYDIPIKEFLR